MVMIGKLKAGNIRWEDLNFFPCVRSGIYFVTEKGEKHDHGYGKGLAEYLNTNAKGEINYSYSEGNMGYLSFKSKKGNDIRVEIAGGSLNSTGDYLHVTNKTKNREKYILIKEDCKEIDESEYNSALHICRGRLRWK